MICVRCGTENPAEANFCRKCAKKMRKTSIANPDICMPSQAEHSAHILRGLINYHERMTMGSYPERDFYLEALKFALSCVEEKIEK